MTKFEFIHRLNQAAEEALLAGVRFNKSALFAQAALESDWGNSELVKLGNNLFAVKAGETWNGEVVTLNGPEWNARIGWYSTEIFWRKYAGWTECILDFAAIISKLPWFQDALQYLNNPDMYLKSLLPEGSQPGWATDPQYYKKVKEIAAELELLGGPKWT